MRDETKRAFETWLRAAGLLLVVVALLAFISGFFSRKFQLQTGQARWIWIDHPLDAREPIAFFAVRDVEVPPAPPLVRLRLACDADWTLYLNGIEVAGGAATAEPVLHVFDLDALVRKGETNRIAFALRSASGVGGLLATIDYAPLRENDVVTDDSWRLCRRWSAGLANGETACEEKPLVLGAPPFGRWNYPPSMRGRFFQRGGRDVIRVAPGELASIARREIRVLDGLAVESATAIPATIFDFGVVEGRGRVVLPEPAAELTVVEVRYANATSELAIPRDSESFVFAPGESEVTDPVSRSFRMMAVADARATALVDPHPLLTEERSAR
jgi:hypothetical protein